MKQRINKPKNVLNNLNDIFYTLADGSETENRLVIIFNLKILKIYSGVGIK